MNDELSLRASTWRTTSIAFDPLSERGWLGRMQCGEVTPTNPGVHHYLSPLCSITASFTEDCTKYIISNPPPLPALAASVIFTLNGGVRKTLFSEITQLKNLKKIIRIAIIIWIGWWSGDLLGWLKSTWRRKLYQKPKNLTKFTGKIRWKILKLHRNILPTSAGSLFLTRLGSVQAPLKHFSSPRVILQNFLKLMRRSAVQLEKYKNMAGRAFLSEVNMHAKTVNKTIKITIREGIQ